MKTPGLIASALLLCTAGCGGDTIDGGSGGEPPWIGDLAEIRARGELRVLLPDRLMTAHLPRRGHSLDFEAKLLENFARDQRLKLAWIRVAAREELIPRLLQGQGDVVAGNLTVSDERRRVVDFTVPVAVVREQLVTRIGDDSIHAIGDLAGRRIAVRPSSSFWRTVKSLQARQPSIDIEAVPERVDTEEMIHRVAKGVYDLTVADSNLVRACLEYRADVWSVLDLTGDRSIALAVRPGSSDLLESLNRFLTETQLSNRAESLHVGDLAEIRRRKVFRVLTRNTGATYFLWRGMLRGFEYELASEFARLQGLHLEMIVPPDNEDLLAWLVEGRGDLVAAAWMPSQEGRDIGAAFSRPYNFVSQVVVTRANDSSLSGPGDLTGRTFVVRRGSSYWETLESLRRTGLDFDLRAASENLEAEDLIAMVADGDVDLTLSDSHVLDIELSWRDDVRAAFSLRDGIPLVWAVRESNAELRAAIDEFLTRQYRGELYNVLVDRYFKNRRRIRRRAASRRDGPSGLSPYDDIVKKHAVEHGFDWRLIVAQMYQESRFDPRALSPAGARGLMQVLPRTAAEFGLNDLDDPETAILAGVRYLDWVRDRFEEDLPVRDRMWFALAGYNAGPGHVRDARRLAGDLGLNPNRWFGNVEEAMLLLSRPEYASRARNGYCRCKEPVQYVREVRARYNAYVETSGS